MLCKRNALAKSHWLQRAKGRGTSKKDVRSLLFSLKMLKLVTFSCILALGKSEGTCGVSPGPGGTCSGDSNGISNDKISDKTVYEFVGREESRNETEKWTKLEYL